MSTTSPVIQNLARPLLAVEPALVGRSDGDVDQAVRACDRLRVPLSRLTGVTGFSSLLSRALSLATRRAPGLAALRVAPDGSLEGSKKIPPTGSAAEIVGHEGAILVSELLALLVVLVGERLTLNLVREAWPDVSIQSTTLRTEEKP